MSISEKDEQLKDEKLVIIDDPSKYPPELRHTLDGRARRWFLRTWPPQRLAPDAEPVYVRSWLYVFGILTLCSLIMCIITGVILSFFGPEWWLDTGIGAFTDALHYWSVELFFLFMSVHFLAVFLMGAFRGGRKVTWILGTLSFGAAVITAFTGYASLQDFESQWITTQAKDAFNSIGVGSLFNLLNTGQTTTMHVVLFPLILGIIVGIHVLWIRKHGVCPPYDVAEQHFAAEQSTKEEVKV